MKLTFNSMIIHNFLSFGHSEIDFHNKGYCVVNGVNNNPLDKAISNGSGKSTLFSAICWALIGETIQGISSNIKNINVEENSCYVTLDFNADTDHFVITRSKEPKADLKIYINDKDESGKGIRESEAILATRLPDLSNNLIAATIILGQGLPNKFTANTPSGRKEILEKLSKSDFMIRDLKDKISVRYDKLNQQLREYDDKILADTSKQSAIEDQLKQLEEKLTKLSQTVDYEQLISNYEKKLTELSTNKEQLTEAKNNSEKICEDAQREINKIGVSITEELEQENADFNEFNAQYLEKKAAYSSTIKVLQSQIEAVKNIKDICPTCGQKIPGVVKRDTSKEEAELNDNIAALNKIESVFKTSQAEHLKAVAAIRQKHTTLTEGLTNNITTNKQAIIEVNKQLQATEQEINSANAALAQTKADRSNHAKNIEEVTTNINSCKDTIKILINNILYNNSEKQSITERISVINQINTLVKRDFRGFLLSNIIEFIEHKAKEYCMDVFETDRLSFALDGNNIDISYCNRPLENLSGGERQRIDIIIQLAIRDMMSQYLAFSSNILVLDEIFDALDTLSCTKILNLISRRLDDVESIYIISHRASELEIPYDTELTIVKDDKGVSKIR